MDKQKAAALKADGLSHRAIAKAIGVSHTQVNRWAKNGDLHSDASIEQSICDFIRDLNTLAQNSPDPDSFMSRLQKLTEKALKSSAKRNGGTPRIQLLGFSIRDRKRRPAPNARWC